MDEFDLIFWGVCYLLSVIVYFLQITTSKVILTDLKRTVLKEKRITETKFNEIRRIYKSIYFLFTSKNNIVDVDIKYLFIIAFIPIFNILFSGNYQDFVKMIKKSVNDMSNSTIDSHEIIIKNKILKYIDKKTQFKEKEMVEKALNNKNNPYFELISENAKMINDTIIEFEKNDYILNKERAINFNKDINDTILSFVQAIELIDDLNLKTDITTINLTKYNNYLTDLKSDLKDQINTK